MSSRWWEAGFAVLVAAGVAWAMVARETNPREDAVRNEPPTGDGGADSAVTWTGSVVVDTGGGHVGPWRMNESDWRYVDDPTVALDAEGGAAVAWVDQARKDVLFRRYGPDGAPRPEEPVNVSRSPDVFSWLPRMVISPDGTRIHLLWQEIVFSGGTHGGEAFFARSTDGGRSFSEPVDLSNTSAGVGKGRSAPGRWHNGSLDLALGPDGGPVAAWTAYEGGLWVSRSLDGRGSFSEPLRVTAGGEHEPARAPSLAVGPDGGVHLAWAVGEDPSADLRYATSEDGGRSFGETRVLFAAGGHADAPKLAVDREGTVHLAWAEGPPGAVEGYRIRYARAPSVEDGGAGAGFGEARDVSGRIGAERGSRYPSLALDGDGDPHLVWELYPARPPFPGIPDRPRGLGYTASTDGGDSFAAPTLVPGTADPDFAINGSLQGLLMRKLAVNGRRGVAVVNSGFEPNEASRVVLIRGRIQGR